jgi:lambda family phage portal protein
MERLLARTWFRDGEAFKVYQMGVVPFLAHSYTKVPLSLEIFEPDYCPLGYSDPLNGIVQGVARNGWGQPVRYYFAKYHPGSPGGAGAFSNQGYKQVPSNYVNHLKFTRRIGQVRGESVFSAVLLRLDDLKDYEEAERIAARIAAKLVGYVRKGTPDMYGNDQFGTGGRERQAFEDGMILYDMLPGEEVGLFDNTKRPNSGLAEFRSGQLRATAAGTMVSYSSASKDYNGTYSAQRQELVEQQESYEVLQDYFISHACKPDYKAFVQMAVLGGLKVPPDVNMDTLFDVACYGTAMPWVDPMKEAKANVEMLNAGLTSHSEVIRRRGGNPTTVFRQRQRDLNVMNNLGILPQMLANPTPGLEDGLIDK